MTLRGPFDVRIRALIFAAIGIFAAVGVFAAISPLADASDGGSPGVSFPAEGVTLSLTLEDCVLRAYENNLGVQASRDAAASSALEYMKAQGRFEPAFFLDAVGAERINPSGAQLIGGIGYQDDFDEDTFSLSTGFRGLLHSGATYQVDLALYRSYIAEASAFSINPQVINNMGIEVKQPLLRNGWTSYNRADAFSAVLGSHLEDFNYESTLSETLFTTVEAYWNFVYAIESEETTRKSLDLAEDLLAINTRKQKEGLFTKMDVLEASADVATRRQQLITAVNEISTAEDSLKRLIFPFDRADDWDVKIEPLTLAVVNELPSMTVDSLVGEALENRADYLALEIEKKTTELELLRAANQTLPALDLTGSYRINSIGTNMGNSFNEYEGRDYASFSVALSLEVPIGNQTALGSEQQSMIAVRRAARNVQEKKIAIAYEIREGLRDLSLQLEKLDAARESKRLSKERYEGELRRLETGRSITYLVREAERNYFLQSELENRALLDYQIALARLEKYKGTLLAHYGITVRRSLDEDWIYS